jgi:hypothetical protein
MKTCVVITLTPDEVDTAVRATCHSGRVKVTAGEGCAGDTYCLQEPLTETEIRTALSDFITKQAKIPIGIGYQLHLHHSGGRLSASLEYEVPGSLTTKAATNGK